MASKITDFSTPFSFETASTTNRISLLISSPTASGRQPRHRNISKRQTCQFAVDLEQHLAAFHAHQPTRESPSTVERIPQFDLRVLAAEAREVRERSQPSIETRRRHLEHVTSRQRILDVEESADLLAHALAIVERHAAFAVNEQPQKTAPPEMRIEIRELETHRRDRRLQQLEQTLFVDRLSHRLRTFPTPRPRPAYATNKNGPYGPLRCHAPPRLARIFSAGGQA